MLRRFFIVLNVGLLVAIAILAFRQTAPATDSAVAAKPVAAKPSVHEPTTPHYPDAATPADQRRWLVDQLRALGVPNRVLARIVLKDLDQRWNKYATEVSLKTRGDAEVLTALNLEIEQDREKEMRAALGEAGFKEWDTENMSREINNGHLDFKPAETEAAYALWKKLRARDFELRQMKAKGQIDEAGAGELYAKDLTAFQQQMKSLLGDERYAQSQATGSNAVAANLKQDLAQANPTDAQFQELLKTQQQWNDLRTQLAQHPLDDATYAQKLKDLDEARDEEYRRVLGADAFDALQKQQDPRYTEMKKYAGSWGLDDAKIDYVYGAMKYYQKSAEDYQSALRGLEAQGQKVDWDAVSKNLQQFAQQTQQALQNYVGPESFSRLQKNGLVQLNQPLGDQPNSPGGRHF